MTDFKKSLLNPEARISEALTHIEESEGKIVLVVDDMGTLIGTVTDGDIRRGLLAGYTLASPVTAVINSEPVSVSPQTDMSAVFALMQMKVLRQIPVVDNAGRVIGLRLLHEILRPANLDNRVVIMAGGRGERLRPFTDNCPKPMLEVGGRPILETTICRCAAAGFHKFSISVNYRAEVIKKYFGDGSKFGVAIEYLEESQPLGTAGSLGLLAAKTQLPLIVMNGDILTNVNLSEMMAFHGEQGAMITMGVRSYDFQIPYGVVEMEDDRIGGIREKPVAGFVINAGIYVLEPDLLRFVQAGTRLDMPKLIEVAKDKGFPARAFPIREYWLDIGNLHDLEQAKNDFSKIKLL